jgi:hypothetical protein
LKWWPLLCVFGCATGGEAGGGGSELPNRGFSPYETVQDGDAGVLRVVLEADEPCAVADGDGVFLYLQVCDGDRCAIERRRADDGVHFGEPEPVRDDGRAPFATSDGRLAYVTDAGFIAVDDDVSTHQGSAPSLTTDALYFVRDDAVWRAVGDEAVQVFGAAESGWDRDGVADAEVRAETTATGRDQYRMVYTAVGGGIGFAASADGTTWSRFAFNPVLEGSARGPTNLRLGDRYALYFAVGRIERFVVAAFDDAGAASSAF